MVATYYEQIRALVAGGVDILLPETSFDTLVLKACLFAIDKYFADHQHAPAGDGLRAPSSKAAVHSLARPSEAFYTSIAHFDALSVGSTAPSASSRSRPYVEKLRRCARTRSVAIPMPGCPTAWAVSSAIAMARRADAGRVCPQWLDQHRRRLLRHHAGMDCRHRAGPSKASNRARCPNCRSGRITAAPNSWWSGLKPISS